MKLRETIKRPPFGLFGLTAATCGLSSVDDVATDSDRPEAWTTKIRWATPEDQRPYWPTDLSLEDGRDAS